MTGPRKRPLANDYRHLRDLVGGLCNDLLRYEWSHAEWLEQRSMRLFDDPAWTRATSPTRDHMLRYMEGWTDAVWKLRIVWTLTMTDGSVQPSPLPAHLSYMDVEPELGKYRWATSGKVWS